MRLKAVVNLFGGPGIGKSTVASELFTILKKEGKQVELINEYAKDLTWEKRHTILQGDQLYVFAKQHRRLLRVKDHIDVAICESPLILSSMYIDEEHDLCSKEVFVNTSLHIFNKYPNINFFLERDKKDIYNRVGRNQNKEEALIIDKHIVDYLKKYNITYSVIERSEISFILASIDILLQK